MIGETDSLVDDLMSILNPVEPNVPKIKKAVLSEKNKNFTETPLKNRGIGMQNKSDEKTVDTKVPNHFLEDIGDSDNPSQKANIFISKDIYEIFMTLKRAKNVKNVTLLLDYALKDFIKRHAKEIKKLIYDSQNNEIL